MHVMEGQIRSLVPCASFAGVILKLDLQGSLSEESLATCYEPRSVWGPLQGVTHICSGTLGKYYRLYVSGDCMFCCDVDLSSGCAILHLKHRT